MKVGQQVLAVSDPGYQGQMLSLKTKPSKMALTRAVSHNCFCYVGMSTVDFVIGDVAMRQDIHTPLIFIRKLHVPSFIPTLHSVTGMQTLSVLYRWLD